MTAPTLAEVRDRLVAVAKAGDTITYTDLYGDRYLAHARASGDLGEISLLEHMAGRPLLSVVAVSKTTGQPSHGLFDLALLHDQGKTTPEIPIRAALVIEQEPSDLRWVEVCAAVGVVLAWPERFAAVFIGIGIPGSDSEH